MQRLKLLDYCSVLFKNVDFEKTLLIGCQHILPTNFVMFNYLFNKGLKPQNTFVIGKSYSTHKQTENKFKSRGAYIHKYAYKSHKSFDKQLNIAIKLFIREISKRVKTEAYEKIIIIDDAGKLLRFVNQHKSFKKNVVCVEQTSSGYEDLKKIELRFPIINVARSQAKLLLESPYIAKAVTKVLQRKIKKLKLSPKEILIIGKGPIGASIAGALENKYRVKIFDVDSNKSHYDHNNIKKILPELDLYIGCTGMTVLSKKDYKYLKKGAILVSASSSDREFDAFHLRKLTKENNNPHKDISVKGIHLLNSGFPLNFQGTEIEKNEEIQLTRSLMFSAICLASKNRYKPGFVELDSTIQQKISTEYARV